MTHNELAQRIETAEGPVLLEQPEFCPGCYSLFLYCKYDNPAHDFREFPHEYDAWQTYGEAAKAARSKGWILHRDRTATCPKCAAAIRARSAS